MSTYPLKPTHSRPRCVNWGCGCLALPLLALCLVLVLAVYTPGRTNILILGIDAREPGSNLGRSDTIILATFIPVQPYIGLLSIPRDLWVSVPGHGEERINTAHIYGELAQPGGGPPAAMATVRANFGVDMHYYLRIRFDGLRAIVDALGGVEVTLPEAMSGYPAGAHHLNGEQALALVRDRQGSDDLYRMERGQIFMRAVLKQLLAPNSWPRLPQVIPAIAAAVDTNIPISKWPAIGLLLLRLGSDGLDGRTITHEMVTPTTTSGGASVLLPKWESINPVLLEMFGP
jgi:LCP family protein required for cell wall assembly